MHDKKAVKELRKILMDTADVNDTLLISLRNRIIQMAKWEETFPLNLHTYLVNEVNEELLVFTTGYAFFDYTL